jgi:hypothetical protein
MTFWTSCIIQLSIHIFSVSSYFSVSLTYIDTCTGDIYVVVIMTFLASCIYNLVYIYTKFLPISLSQTHTYIHTNVVVIQTFWASYWILAFHTHTYVYTYNLHTYIQIQTLHIQLIHVYTHKYVYTYNFYTYIHMCVHVHVYTHMCMYTCIYTHVYTRIRVYITYTSLICLYI